jgi:hypothetical protein
MYSYRPYNTSQDNRLYDKVDVFDFHETNASTCALYPSLSLCGCMSVYRCGTVGSRQAKQHPFGWFYPTTSKGPPESSASPTSSFIIKSQGRLAEHILRVHSRTIACVRFPQSTVVPYVKDARQECQECCYIYVLLSATRSA